MAFEGNFNVIETKAGSGEYKFAPAPDGKFDNASDAASAILKAKAITSGWALWLDGDGWDKLPAKGKPVSATMLAAFIKAADEAEMVMVRHKWPQLKLKLTKGASKYAKGGRAVRHSL